MYASDLRVLKMDVRCALFKLLLFQLLVTWCGAKHVTIADLPKAKLYRNVREEVQGFIQNQIHTGKPYSFFQYIRCFTNKCHVETW